ncbi:hypothetical protein BO78DRAFT_116497 [Aspergillus sclerotiicarbonarius CBS 121057]|uniref:Uncharacterized protein n=1 Tax=Aspergillus sclerotiicarbonarius (strain CBS 121057 / IBT 28362) TaxID=1448318 RepID=A0A319E8R8_ASPSB|nr:hypothetical protein BO78DRAFT_116497 [Aspergillus sclerotiicarbonarius CBS 121057]
MAASIMACGWHHPLELGSRLPITGSRTKSRNTSWSWVPTVWGTTRAIRRAAILKTYSKGNRVPTLPSSTPNGLWTMSLAQLTAFDKMSSTSQCVSRLPHSLAAISGPRAASHETTKTTNRRRIWDADLHLNHKALLGSMINSSWYRAETPTPSRLILFATLVCLIEHITRLLQLAQPLSTSCE